MLTSRNGRERGCPYAGLPDDPSTRLLFAAEHLYCHRAQPAEAVALSHQEAFCLSPGHLQCPVFASEKTGPLPRALRQDEQNESGGKRLARFARLAGWGALTLLGLALLFVLTDRVARTVLAPASAPPTLAALARVATATPAATPTALPPATLPAAEGAVLPPPATAPAVEATPLPPTATATSTAVPTVVPTIVPTIVPTAEPTRLLPTETAVPPLAEITVAFANVRNGPSLSYDVLANQTAPGATFPVVGKDSTGGWWQVCCLEGQPGWVAADNVIIRGDAGSVPVVPPPQPYMVVNVERLNIRSGPGTDYPTLRVASFAERYDMVAQSPNGTWWQVCCVDGAPGWVIGVSILIYGDAQLLPVAANIPPPPSGGGP